VVQETESNDMEGIIDLSLPLPQFAPVNIGLGTSADYALVAAARDGDRAAFGRLHDRFAPMVHGILLSRVPRGEVEDLLQEVFLKALRQLESLRDADAFGAWLARIARNCAADFYRNRRDEESLNDDVMAASSTDLEAVRVLSLIRTLPEAYRETLVLRLVEGMTGPEIAARTGLTQGSVRVNLHRGVRLLREKMGLE
jgi:RNA polymerase sigma-70 factor (ECF subfamily)